MIKLKSNIKFYILIMSLILINMQFILRILRTKIVIPLLNIFHDINIFEDFIQVKEKPFLLTFNLIDFYYFYF